MENNGNFTVIEMSTMQELFLHALTWMPDPFPYPIVSVEVKDADMYFADAIRGGQGMSKATQAANIKGWVMQTDIQQHLLNYWISQKRASKT